ncbi:hypothetical protein JHK87_051035 [Glycine soja]|nr:hypothetical protein JHK87_051035 [Glycine soja]
MDQKDTAVKFVVFDPCNKTKDKVEKSACDIENLKFGDHQHLEEIWLGVFPNLVLLSLKKEDAIGILQGQFQARTISQIDYSDGSCCYSSLSSHPSGDIQLGIYGNELEGSRVVEEIQCEDK